MNAERLLAQFERISEAPDAITRLRRFILDLAVRGKLVEQDPEDEPAEELLMCIAKHNKPSLSAASDKSSFPFELPTGWTRTTFRTLVESSGSGWSPKALDTPREGNEWGILKVSAVSWDQFRPEANKQILPGTQPRPHAVVRKGDFLISRANTAELVARAVIVDSEPVNLMMSDKIVRLELVDLCEPKYILINNNHSTFSRSYYADRATGVSPSMKNVTRDVILDLPIPLPPLAEQHRIVAKVDDLMVLCDQLEAARQQRQQGRKRLVAATLQRLNQPAEDTASFRNDASFALQVLPSLTTTPAQIKRLRQTILNLAVRGKLVEQDPEDEPAISWLLQRVEGNYSRRIRKTVATRDEGCQDSTISILPETWLWVVLDDLVLVMDSGWSPQCEDHPRSSIESWGVLKTTAVQSLFFDERHHKELPSNLQPRPQHEAREGDILITRAGPKNRVGISCVIDKIEPRLMISDKIIRLRLADGLSPCFVALALNAGRSSEAVEDAKSGMAVMQMNISQVKLRTVPIPLPPLAEQHRIVAKVDELMALCDQLEQQLSQADQQRRRLLEAVLAEALVEPEQALAAMTWEGLRSPAVFSVDS